MKTKARKQPGKSGRPPGLPSHATAPWKLFAAGAMLVLSRMRTVLDALRNLTGLPDTPLTLFLMIGGVFLLMFFRFSVIISRLKDNNIALAQRLAILEYHVQGLKKNEN